MLHSPPVAQARAQATAGTQSPRIRRHVLMVAPTSFFADYGCHVRILEEARTLRRLGQRVTIATYRNGKDIDGFDIRRTLPIPWRNEYEVGSSRHKVAFDALLTWTALAAAWRIRPDVIHGHLHEGALIGALVSKVLRIPLVFDYQGSLASEMVDHGFLAGDGTLHGWVRALERWIDRRPDAVVTSSAHAARRLQRDLGNVEVDVTILPDCVDVETFRPGLVSEDTRRRWLLDLGIPADRKLVVYLGLLAHYQGTDLLIEAASRVVQARPEAHFLIMGFPGVDQYRAQAEAAGLADRVTFTGPVPYQEAPAHLDLGAVAVAPKLSATEGSGKILNYMAMGLPVVAFDTPVSREYLQDLGAYADPGNADDLAARIVELLADDGRRTALGQGLRQRAADAFSWDHAGQRILQVYERVDRRPVAAEGEA